MPAFGTLGFNLRGYHEQKGMRDWVDTNVPEEVQHFAVTSLINLAARNPYVFGATLIGHGAWHLYDLYRGEVKVNREFGALSTPTPTRTISTKRRQERASAERGKSGGPRQSSQRGGRARRKKCPRGHYWSYKKKKCVKSRFRSRKSRSRS